MSGEEDYVGELRKGIGSEDHAGSECLKPVCCRVPPSPRDPEMREGDGRNQEVFSLEVRDRDNWQISFPVPLEWRSGWILQTCVTNVITCPTRMTTFSGGSDMCWESV